MTDRREDLPAGTVTFVFTDLEGSTRLLQEVGDASYAAILDEHRRSVRAITTANGGVEVDTQGDAFFLVFASAEAAVAAAGSIALASDHGVARPRIGVHTGTPFLGPDGYVGADVHLAARIAAAAHGGQVLISSATRRCLGPDVVHLDLGEHLLKDIPSPVPLHQLGTSSFPPLRTLANSTIPHPASSFVGRETEVEQLCDILQGDARLVTLTGPGGTGKTRMAIEAVARLGRRYPAGTFWVPLRTVLDPDLVRPAISSALGNPDDLVEHIAERTMLLLVDNAEQVLTAAPVLGELLASCPNLRLLVTSRAPLHLAGEMEVPIPPMALADAVALFCARARRDPDDEIETLCRELDALPLAVELAAARTSVLSPRQIRDRLGSRLDLLKGGRELDPRPETLRSTIDWSYGLLDQRAQALFRQLSVFPGGATFAAIESVLEADVDVLAALVDQSLVRRSGDRFWMLASLQRYAEEAFATDPTRPNIERSFRAWALSLADEADRHLRGRDQLRWMSVLDTEAANLRAAFEGYLRDADPDGARRLVLAVGWWQGRRYIHEARAWEAASLALDGGDPALRGWTMLRRELIHRPEAVNAFREVVELAVETGDERLRASALESLAMVSTRGADAMLDEAEEIFHRLDSADDLARIAINRAAHELDVGRDSEALARSRVAIAQVRRLGNRHGIGLSLANQAIALVFLGREGEARESLRESLAQFQEVGEIKGQALVVEIASAIAASDGHAREAAVLLGAAHGCYAALDLELEPSDARVLAWTESALGSVEPSLLESWMEEGRRLDLERALEVWRTVDAET